MTDVSTIEYFPNQIFRDKNGPVTVGSARAILAGGTANQNIVGAVTGKCIVVVSMMLVANGAVISTGTFLDGSGGTNLWDFGVPPNTVTPVIFPFNPGGWVSTSAGVGLYASIGPATGVLVGLRYIAFTP